MQYPQIQFYRGSLVRLASGKLKQVEDLSSDDILESVRHLNNNITNKQQSQIHHNRDQEEDENDDDMYIDPVEDFVDEEEEEIDVNNNDNGNNDHIVDNKIVQQYGCHDDLMTMISDFDIYMDTSVVRDFLEIGPTTPTPTGSTTTTSSTSTASKGSSTLNLSNSGHFNKNNNYNHNLYSRSSSQPNSCPQTPSPNSVDFNSFNFLTNPNLFISSCSLTSQAQSVLIKFFLESSRTVVFIEVSIEHPFFVLHRGWSSWNPQKTYDKFGLKCRKLKIGDTCISLIRKRKSQQSSSSTSEQDLSTPSSMTTTCSMVLDHSQQQQIPQMHNHLQTTSMLHQAISRTQSMRPIHSIASMLKLTNNNNNNNHDNSHNNDNNNNAMTGPLSNTKLFRETMKL